MSIVLNCTRHQRNNTVLLVFIALDQSLEPKTSTPDLCPSKAISLFLGSPLIGNAHPQLTAACGPGLGDLLQTHPLLPILHFPFA